MIIYDHTMRVFFVDDPEYGDHGEAKFAFRTRLGSELIKCRYIDPFKIKVWILEPNHHQDVRTHMITLVPLPESGTITPFSGPSKFMGLLTIHSPSRTEHDMAMFFNPVEIPILSHRSRYGQHPEEEI